MKREEREEMREVNPEEAESGEEVEEHDGDDDEVGGFEGPWYRFPPMRNALVAGALLFVGWLVGRFAETPGYVPIGIFVLAIFVGAYYWAKEGLEEFVEEREVGIEALMAAATIGAAILGAWFEAAFLAFLFAAAEAVEEYTYARTRTAIRSLLDLAPETATRLLGDGSEQTIPAEELEVGDLFLVRPGERLPTDGEIVEGASSLDESAVTGESVPVEKGEGGRVFAGTINATGSLKVRATTGFESNSLQKIIHLVEEAQGVKSRAQRWIDRFGDRYSPSVLLGALVLLVVPPLFGGPFDTWAYRAVVLLVAAAPCALVMSTPVAVAAAIGRAGKEGVLIKGGIHLENLSGIKVVAFDKTGTLTRGKPVVTDVVSLDGDTGTILRAAASVEHFSEHPLARAIVDRAREEDVESVEARAFQALTGAGAKAEVEGRSVYVGSPALFRDLDGPNASSDGVLGYEEVERLQAEGKTVVLVGDEEGAWGLLALRDEPRPEAWRAIEELHRMGYEVAMLTGDNERTAKAIAGELGIDEVRAELKPEDKVEAVKGLEREHGPVAMVGDGINDSPALATASVGMAMGTAGTDAAIEAADVALMGDEPGKVSYALKLSRRSRGISLQNIVFSVLILAVLIPGAVLGLLGIAAAVFVHEASELLAVANGLRAARRFT